MPPGIWNLINYPILTHVPDKHYSVQLGWLTHFIKNVTCLSSPWLIPFLTSGMEQSVPLLPPEGIGGTDGKMGHSKEKNQAYTAHHDFPCFGISLNNLYMLAVPHCCSESQFQRRIDYLCLGLNGGEQFWGPFSFITITVISHNTISKINRQKVMYDVHLFLLGLSLGR